MSTNHNLKYSRDAVKHPVNFKANDHINLEVNDLPHPSEPSQSIHLRDHGDVKAFVVKHSQMANMKQCLFGLCPPLGVLKCKTLAA